MKGSIFPGEKWCFFMCAIAEGKSIENFGYIRADQR
jgi:hypothetical protein